MIDRVTEHAEKVVSGEVTAGRLHRLACERHLKNLQEQKTEAFPYFYDEARAAEIINYAETLTLSEGAKPRPLKLLPEQAFDLGATFGWFKMSNGARRFRRRYKCMGRQNGKSLENGVIGTYIAAFSGYQHGKLFTVATKKRQARIVWEEMTKFIKSDPDLSQLFTIKDYINLIKCNYTDCTIEALSKESGLDDGFRSIFASIDELHQHKDNSVYKALYNGTRGLPETLQSMITTRGDQLNSFCKEMDDYAVNILEGTATAEDFFVDIYALDDGDDIWDENNWVKANPFICSDPDRMEIFRQDAQTAKDMGGSDLRDFLTKALNMWVQNTDDQFIAPDAWRQCGTDKTLNDMRGRSCYVGVDLSSGGDLTTLSMEFPLDNGGFFVHSHSFMPRGRLAEHVETDLAPYDLWEQQELITVTGGNMDFKNDYKFIVKYLAQLKEEYEINFMGIGIDPHNADGVLADLEAFGCPVVVVVQSARSLNDATADFQLSVKSHKLEYNKNNELLTWSAVNAVVVRNSFDEMKIDKKVNQHHKRIDPIDACINAHTLAMQQQKENPVNVEDEMTKYLDMMGWS